MRAQISTMQSQIPFEIAKLRSKLASRCKCAMHTRDAGFLRVKVYLSSKLRGEIFLWNFFDHAPENRASVFLLSTLWYVTSTALTKTPMRLKSQLLPIC